MLGSARSASTLVALSPNSCARFGRRLHHVREPADVQDRKPLRRLQIGARDDAAADHTHTDLLHSASRSVPVEEWRGRPGPVVLQGAPYSSFNAAATAPRVQAIPPASSASALWDTSLSQGDNGRGSSSKRRELDLFMRLGRARIARAGKGIGRGAEQPVRMQTIVGKRHDDALSRAVMPRIVEDCPTAYVDRRLIHNPMKPFPYILVAAVLEEVFKRSVPEGFAKDSGDGLAGQSTCE